MATLARAIAIAAQAHEDQVDKAGQPYILHPLRVMLRMTNDVERMVAVLHDVVEDGPAWSFERLQEEGFPAEVVSALQAVTKQSAEEDGEGDAEEAKVERYLGFIRRAAAHPVGRRVKMADLQDNCDLSRLAAPTDKDLRRIAKYRRALELLAELEAPGAQKTG
jgi:(p)ppGpp synthase/HD superfamily hydrolase